ncbi:hypothetical protein [Methylocella sp. CPCC 101449]|uniref:hypothetical protein n=1 Tax=Methylocella sp. CPCC 101449 TaxID=2987531 RepID=UPI00288D867E|nr:hypothetical protein [Methylocella sp. CPCC 101449]MDT2022372.1 hypothetical protein [Methylocella sp. CPCC 101449]
MAQNQQAAPRVSALIMAAFNQSYHLHQDVLKAWIDISFSIGGTLPRSSLTMTIQRLGRLDTLIRAIEDERYEDPWMAEPHTSLAEQWIGDAYAVTHTIKSKKLNLQPEGFSELAHDLRILRVQLEKHEIATGAATKQPIELEIIGSNEQEIYDASDPDRKHAIITAHGLTKRHSICWLVIDAASTESSRWIERRELSERFLRLWKKN